MFQKLFLACLAFFGLSCAQVPLDSQRAKKVFSQICSTQKLPSSVEGSVWMKAKSKDASGQFPAAVQVKSLEEMKLEVTDLLGSTEARIEVKKKRYRIEIPKQKKKILKNKDTWAGIPLRWAPIVLLGGVPCPSRPLLKKGEILLGEDDSSFRWVSAKQSFEYTLSEVSKPWVEKVIWSNESQKVVFEFSRPSEEDDSAQHIKISSSKGEVRLRWRERNTYQ